MGVEDQGPPVTLGQGTSDTQNITDQPAGLAIVSVSPLLPLSQVFLAMAETANLFMLWPVPLMHPLARL